MTSLEPPKGISASGPASSAGVSPAALPPATKTEAAAAATAAASAPVLGFAAAAAPPPVQQVARSAFQALSPEELAANNNAISALRASTERLLAIRETFSDEPSFTKHFSLLSIYELPTITTPNPRSSKQGPDASWSIEVGVEDMHSPAVYGRNNSFQIIAVLIQVTSPQGTVEFQVANFRINKARDNRWYFSHFSSNQLEKFGRLLKGEEVENRSGKCKMVTPAVMKAFYQKENEDLLAEFERDAAKATSEADAKSKAITTGATPEK